MADPSSVLPVLRPESNKLTKEMEVLFIRILHKIMHEQHNIKPATNGVS
jgi:hypothetical protein